MGYELERFVDKVPHSFICIICHEAVQNPKECITCENLFCSECIQKCLQQIGSCPNKCEKSEFQKPGRIVRTNLEDLVIKCKFWKQGCVFIDKLSEIEYHQRDECTYNSDIKKCLNYLCQIKDTPDKMIVFKPVGQDEVEQYVCSLKCATMVEFKQILESAKNPQECLPLIQEKLQQTLNSVAENKLPIIEYGKELAYISTEKVKRGPTELPDSSTYQGE